MFHATHWQLACFTFIIVIPVVAELLLSLIYMLRISCEILIENIFLKICFMDVVW